MTRATADNVRPTAVITGATGGIGGAIAMELSRTHDVWLAGRDAYRLNESASRLGAARTWLIEQSGDTVPPPTLDRVDVLVLAAGAWSAGWISETDTSAWQRMFEANVFGPVAVARALQPALRNARGRVVVFSSTAVDGSPAGRAAYAASKAALETFARALHAEERENGVAVTTVVPGRVATEMLKRVTVSEGGSYDATAALAPSLVAEVVRTIIDAADDLYVARIVLQPPHRPKIDPGRPTLA